VLMFYVDRVAVVDLYLVKQSGVMVDTMAVTGVICWLDRLAV